MSFFVRDRGSRPNALVYQRGRSFFFFVKIYPAKTLKKLNFYDILYLSSRATEIIE